MNEPNNQNAALYAALAAAQGAFLPIEKNRSVKITMKTGGTYNFRYADLEEIIAKTRPALSANGLALIQPMTILGNDARLTCELVHKEGGRIVSEVSIQPPHSSQDPKQFGATVSYFRRYMITAMLGVAADDDLDEDGQEMEQKHVGKPAVAVPVRRQEPEQPRAVSKPQTTAGDGTLATAGELAYLMKKISAKGITVAEARALAGLDYVETLDGLSKDGFTSLKDAMS